MRNIYWLSQIQPKDRSLVGSELFILSQLLQHENPILPGLVFGNNLWREFLSQTNSWRSLTAGQDSYQSLRNLAQHSRQSIIQQTIPLIWQPIIERATQQLDSSSLLLQPFLIAPTIEQKDVNSLWQSHTCENSPQALDRAIKLAWSELFTATSLTYLCKLGLDWETINLAILVRPLKNADASGIVTIGDGSIQIQSTWGLSQSLLQGDVEPDLYCLERDWGQIFERRLGHKNYGYRLKSSASFVSDDLLEAYLPSEHLAESYVLDAEAIAKLLQIVQKIIQQQPRTKYLVWNAARSSASSALNFYITQVSERYISDTISNSKFAPDPASIATKPPLLSGIAASPGTTQAKLAIIPDLNNHTQKIPSGVILVTRAIDPQHVPLLKQIKGIITEVGGKNSHAAIVARELNIPAIANIANATQTLQDNEQILLDGNSGHIYPPHKEQTISPIRQGILAPTYPIATRLMVNLSQPESISITSNLPVDGVGLLRSELMLADLLSDRTLAQWQESFQQQFLAAISDRLRQFVEAFAPRPVFYRSLDLYGYNDLNPVLGDRGTYSYISDPTLFDLEIEALRQVTTEGNRNINLILPFVRSVEEFKFCYRRLENIGLTSQANFQVWIMAEVPSIIMLLPEYIRAGVKGIAIGTNDLTQLLLGVDREQTQFSDRGLNANHPAMQQAISELIVTAHEHNIKCCICGQAPVEHPELIDFLIQWGIDAISVEPNAVATTYKAIARAEKKMLLNQMRDN